MKSTLLAIIVILFKLAPALGQDKDLENRFYNDRSKIKESKIKEVTEWVSGYREKPCNKDSADRRFRYEFGIDGDLMRIDEFHREHYWKTTNYVRNKKGDYIQKNYTFYDSLNNVKRKDDWTFEFNRKGQRILEIWMSGKDTIRINKLSYDKKGNYVEQFTDGWLKWRFKYDDKNKIVESDECRLMEDSIHCYSLTKYTYEKGLLQRVVIYAKGNAIWKEFDYTYDVNQRLVELRQQWHSLVQRGNEPMRKEIRLTTILFQNDSKGNCVVKSEFNQDENEPFRCTYYEYKYY